MSDQDFYSNWLLTDAKSSRELMPDVVNLYIGSLVLSILTWLTLGSTLCFLILVFIGYQLYHWKILSCNLFYIEHHDLQCMKRKCFMQRTRVLKTLTALRSVFNKAYVKCAICLKTINFLKSRSVRRYVWTYLIKYLKRRFLLSRTGFSLHLNKNGHKDQPYISE